eukprot:scaffold124572_cov27-Tisochrysis_lutea.AAC.7
MRATACVCVRISIARFSMHPEALAKARAASAILAIREKLHTISSAKDVSSACSAKASTRAPNTPAAVRRPTCAPSSAATHSSIDAAQVCGWRGTCGAR